MYDREQRAALAQELARAFLRTRWTPEALAESGAGCLDRWPRWMDALAFHLAGSGRGRPDFPGVLAGVIEDFLAERSLPADAPPDEGTPPQIIRAVTSASAPGSLRRRPGGVFGWPVAPIASVTELAARLELDAGQLAWLADVRSWERTVVHAKLRNYRYRVVPRAGGLPRVIEIPKARLKEIQRWILREILDHVPAHDAAHGFARGRSVVSHARLHTGQDAVLRLDLRDFFASIPAGRVYGIFDAVGYGADVAHVLTGLCTNVVPLALWHAVGAGAGAGSDPRLVGPRFWLGRQLATPHLPQGAPTSPALANLSAFRLDRRISVLAAALELRYSRYADDLTFSGPGLRGPRPARLEGLVAAIARSEGFALHHAKSSLRTAGGRQTVCGVVVNVRPNVTRGEYDRLRAILHNIARDGPAAHDRAGVGDLQAHLRGRVAWVASLNPVRGARLRRQFDAIDWGAPPG